MKTQLAKPSGKSAAYEAALREGRHFHGLPLLTGHKVAGEVCH